MRMMLIVALCVSLGAVMAHAQDTPKTEAQAAPKAEPSVPTLDTGKLSYTIGVQIGKNVKQIKDAGIELDMDKINEGMKDVVAGKELSIPEDELKAIQSDFGKVISVKQREMEEKQAKDNEAAQKTFMEENASKEGVVTLPSGLQYKVVKEGAGASPVATDTVKVNYEGKLLDGTVFDSSYKRGEPMTFQANKVIKGWTEALQLMKPGAEWELYIPADLAYGRQGRPGIPPNSMLIFKVELLEVVAAPEGAPKADGTPKIEVTPKAEAPKAAPKAEGEAKSAS